MGLAMEALQKTLDGAARYGDHRAVEDLRAAVEELRATEAKARRFDIMTRGTGETAVETLTRNLLAKKEEHEDER